MSFNLNSRDICDITKQAVEARTKMIRQHLEPIYPILERHIQEAAQKGEYWVTVPIDPRCHETYDIIRDLDNKVPRSHVMSEIAYELFKHGFRMEFESKTNDLFISWA